MGTHIRGTGKRSPERSAMTKITITVEAETDDLALLYSSNAVDELYSQMSDTLTDVSQTKGNNTYSVKVERREG
jgi:hypothetical protein